MEYDWDDTKNAINLEKHGIEFFEVVPLLESGAVDVTYDEEHSTHDQERYIYTGYVDPHGVVMVVTADLNENLTIIISARKV